MATDLSIYESEDKTWTVTITDSTGSAVDITGYTFLFAVKNRIDDPDSAAIIKKTITSHLDPTAGKTTISISASDTEGISGNYFYDYQWLDTTNNRRPILKNANFQIEQRIGDSFS